MKSINRRNSLLALYCFALTVLGLVDKIVGAVKSGATRRFFVIGGCDGR